jgi:phospholipase C
MFAARIAVSCGYALFLAAIAAAGTARQRTGTIEDMEHIVVFMQENRAFDHYCA